MSLMKFIIRKPNFHNHMKTLTRTHTHTTQRQTDGIFSSSSFLPRFLLLFFENHSKPHRQWSLSGPNSSACSAETFDFPTSYFTSRSLHFYLFDINFLPCENVMENKPEFEHFMVIHFMGNWIFGNRWPIIKSHSNGKPHSQKRWKTFQIDELMEIPTNYMKVSICLHIDAGDSSTNKNETYSTLMNTWHLVWWLKANNPHPSNPHCASHIRCSTFCTKTHAHSPM